MSKKNPIPVRLREQFYAEMAAADDVADDLPDDAWFSFLEEHAQAFMDQHRLRWADSNAAVHQYLNRNRGG